MSSRGWRSAPSDLSVAIAAIATHDAPTDEDAATERESDSALVRSLAVYAARDDTLVAHNSFAFAHDPEAQIVT
jgi:hypothetical protein